MENRFLFDGIFYDLDYDNSTAEVTLGNYSYSGDIIIPSMISVGGYPFSVIGIGEMAFSSCAELTSIELPIGLEYIGVHAFNNCISLASINFPETLSSIDRYAFKDCILLEKVYIPKQVDYIANTAFYHCSSLVDISVSDENQTFDSRNSCNAIINTAKNSLVLGCRSTIIPDTVVNIEYSAFSGCVGLLSIDIPNSVEEIEDFAFSQSSIVSITIPENMKVMGLAFSDCSELKSVNWNAIDCGETYRKYQHEKNSIWGPFGDTASNIVSIKFGSKVEKIPSYLCCNMSSIVSVIIPDNVVSIGDRTFFGCSVLRNLKISTNLIHVGSESFSHTRWYDNNSDDIIYLGKVLYKYNVENACGKPIYIKDGTVSIASEAFKGKDKLTEIYIPDSVTEIERFVFMGCAHLTNVRLPKGLKKIEWLTFGECTSLTSIELPNGLTCIGQCAFSKCKNLSSIEIPNTVEVIENNAFHSCSSLSEITIPDSVKTIGNWAFADCRFLLSVKLSNNLSSIGNNIFDKCVRLHTISTENADLHDYCKSVMDEIKAKREESQFKMEKEKIQVLFKQRLVPTTYEVIIRDFAEAWKTMNPELMIKHLAEEFKYDSQWVLASLDKDGYADYLRGKFSNLKKKGITVQVEIVPDSLSGKQMLKLTQQDGSVCFYRIKVHNSKVIKGDMCMF